MAGDPVSTVIGVFPNYEQVNVAIDELRRNRFSYDRIRVVQHGTGSFFDNLRGMFTGQSSVASNTVDDLTKMGLPDYEARHYQQELEAHHILLLMNADDRPEDAFRILRQNGAFDIDARLRTSPSDVRAEAPHHNGAQETTPADQQPVATRPDVSQPAPQQAETPPEITSPDIEAPPSTADATAETPRNV